MLSRFFKTPAAPETPILAEIPCIFPQNRETSPWKTGSPETGSTAIYELIDIAVLLYFSEPDSTRYLPAIASRFFHREDSRDHRARRSSAKSPCGLSGPFSAGPMSSFPRLFGSVKTQRRKRQFLGYFTDACLTRCPFKRSGKSRDRREARGLASRDN